MATRPTSKGTLVETNTTTRTTILADGTVITFVAPVSGATGKSNPLMGCFGGSLSGAIA
mgnify:CR=1 FL=1